MNLTEIQDLIKFVSKAGVSEVEIEQKDFKIVIKADPDRKRRGRARTAEAEVVQHVAVPVQAAPVAQTVPVTAPVPASPATAPATDSNGAAGEDDKYITVKSPMIGTFYRSAGPDKDAFVNVGDDIQEGNTICIIEAMKLFNEIEAEVSGKIVKVLVDDATPVQYDQPLFLVDPS
jgi:acetyl-CoA carboxylase biotin carboxyl carrier protein